MSDQFYGIRTTDLGKNPNNRFRYKGTQISLQLWVFGILWEIHSSSWMSTNSIHEVFMPTGLLLNISWTDPELTAKCSQILPKNGTD
jgi:hypothetical protein